MIENWSGLGLADGLSLIGRPAAGFGLDLIEFLDARQGFFGDGRALRDVDIKELPADMGQAGDLPDLAAPEEFVEPGIAVGMHPAFEASQMISRPFTSAVRGKAIERRRRCVPGPGPLVANVGPEPCGLDLAMAGRLHADWRIIGKDRLAGQDMAADGV